MNVMKKIRKRAAAAALGAAVAMVAFPSYAADAAPEKITVNLNGTEMNFDVEPIIENGRTLVPFRAILKRSAAPSPTKMKAASDMFRHSAAMNT